MQPGVILNRIIIPILAVSVLAGIAQTSRAQNVSVFRETPFGWLDEADQLSLGDAFDALLEQPDNSSSDWVSDASDARARMKVIDTHEDYGTTCRTVAFRLEARGRKDGGTTRVCQAQDGRWKFAPDQAAE